MRTALIAVLVLATAGLAAPTGAAARHEVGVTRRTAQPANGTIRVCRCADGMTADPVTGTLWLAYNNKIVVYSERTMRVAATISVSVPGGMVADPVTGVVWTTDGSGVSAISGRHYSVLRTVSVPSDDNDGQITVDHKTGAVWVIVEPPIGSGEIQEINEATGKVGATIPQPFPGFPVADPASGAVWLINDKVPLVEISEASASVVAKVGVAGHAVRLAVDPVSGTIWVTTTIYKPRVFEVSAAQHRVIAQIPVRFWFPGSIAADPTTGTVWVAMAAHPGLSLISEGRQAVARTFRLAGSPFDVAVDPRSHMVFTLNNRDGTLNFFRYSVPRFTTASRVGFAVGSYRRFVVRTSGFPQAVMTLRGHLPGGLRATAALGRLAIKGTPSPGDRLGTYRVEVLADNGIGTPHDRYTFIQQVVIRLRGMTLM